MGVDLRENRQMTTVRCRNEDQEIGEEDAAVVQVRGGSAWEHNGGETWLNLHRFIVWTWGEWEREVSMKTSEMAFTKKGRILWRKLGSGVMSQVLC